MTAAPLHALDPHPVSAHISRDGLRGAIRHLGSYAEQGLPVLLGASLRILEPLPGEHGAEGWRATGRATVLAHGGGTAGTGTWVEPGAGYRALCRLVSEAHGRRRSSSGTGTPAGVTRQQLAAGAVDADSGLPVITVLVGPESDVGLAMHGPRYLRPRTLFKEWVTAMPSGTVGVELLSHATGAGSETAVSHAARLLKLAREHQLPAVLSAGPSGAADDAASAGQRIVAAAGLRLNDLRQLHADWERLAERCRLDPAAELVHGIRPLTAPDGHLAELIAALRESGIQCALRTEPSGPAIHLEAGRLRQVHQVIARHLGRSQVALFGEPHAEPSPRHEPEALLPSWLVEPDRDGSAHRPSGSPGGVNSSGALDPCGVVVGERLLDLVPVQTGAHGLPLSQYERSELDSLGLLTVKTLVSREQSVIAHAVREIRRMDPDAAFPADLDAASLRKHHPAAILAGRWEHGDGQHSALLQEAARRHVPVLPVDVSRSAVECRVELCDSELTESSGTGNALGVRLGLGTISGLSSGDAKRIAAGKPYVSMADLRDRARPGWNNLRRLAAAGALNGLEGGSGPELLRLFREMSSRGSATVTEAAEGQRTLDLSLGNS